MPRLCCALRSCAPAVPCLERKVGSHCTSSFVLGSHAHVAPPAVPAVLCPLCLQREDIERMFKEVTEKFGRLDVLVNNAVSQWLQQGGQGGQHA